jgi:hypothetical protein
MRLVLMTRVATVAAAASAVVLIAMSLPATAGAAAAPVRTVSPAAAIIPVVSSNAHKGIGGRYGGLKSRTPRPGLGVAKPGSSARKQPYPYRYYYDTSRGNYGCHRYGKRAIDTDNKNWWLRYRACAEVGSD